MTFKITERQEITMFTAFFESIKYANHLYPIAVLRIYIGYFWFNEGYEKYKESIFSSQLYIDNLMDQELVLRLPLVYQNILANIIAPYWSFWSYCFMGLEVVIGIGLMVGFLTRPLGVLAIIICIHYSLLGSEIVSLLYSTFSAILLTLVIIGAGRCVGFDYYFFKKNRGLLW